MSFSKGCKKDYIWNIYFGALHLFCCFVLYLPTNFSQLCCF